jgi:hypothetical protein
LTVPIQRAMPPPSAFPASRQPFPRPTRPAIPSPTRSAPPNPRTEPPREASITSWHIADVGLHWRCASMGVGHGFPEQ